MDDELEKFCKEQSCHGLIEVLTQYLHGGLVENCKSEVRIGSVLVKIRTLHPPNTSLEQNL